LRRSHNFSIFSPQPGYPAVHPGGFTEDFPQKVRILAACGAKLAAVRPEQVQNAARGLPLDEDAARCICSIKLAPSRKLYTASPPQSCTATAHNHPKAASPEKSAKRISHGPAKEKIFANVRVFSFVYRKKLTIIIVGK
jgi:hypothetical protein